MMTATPANVSASAATAELAHRPDIDGLRAISVGLVIAFHFAAWSMPGGFIGVDVFFVISGYLISGLILNRLHQDRFTFADFYARRFRRIMPALIVVVAVTLAIGCIILMPSDLREAARSSIYAVLGVSNFYFLQNTGYFDITAEMMPFLHTWSLGVEEQFYLVWPLATWGLYRLTGGRSGPMMTVIALVTVASLFLNLVVAQHSPKHDFYLPLTRAWELGLGALLIFLPRLGDTRVGRAGAQILTLTGASLVVGAGIMLKSDLAYPGYYAIAPVVGAALLIYDSGRASLVRSVLSLAPVEFIGRISYSLYLWHWPVRVLWRHFNNGDAPTAIELPGLLAVSLILSVLSWRFIETPARQVRWRPRLVFASAGAAAGLVCGAAFAIVQNDGLSERLSPELRGMSGADVMWNWQCPRHLAVPVLRADDSSLTGNYCAFGTDWDKAVSRVLLWGDSNATHFTQALHRAGLMTGTAVIEVSPCPPIINSRIGRRDYLVAPGYWERCAAQRDLVIAWLAKSPEIGKVILAARWSALTDVMREASSDLEPSKPAKLRLLEEATRDLLTQISSPSRQILIVNDIPPVPAPDPAGCFLSRRGLPRGRKCTTELEVLAHKMMAIHQRPSHQVLEAVGPSFPNTTVISPEDRLCRDDRCATALDGEFIYRDGLHLRRNLSDRTLDVINDVMGFSALMRANAPAIPQR